jgi:predicted transcriptional regulator
MESISIVSETVSSSQTDAVISCYIPVASTDIQVYYKLIPESGFQNISVSLSHQHTTTRICGRRG